MKRNAVIRIVLWSIVLLVLLAILFVVIYVPGSLGRMRHDVIEETMVPVPITETPVTAPTEIPMPENTAADSYNAVAAHNINVRTMPSEEAPAAGMVEQGTALEITRQELVNGTSWGYSPAPVQGWMRMEFVELLGEIPEANADVQVTIPQEEGQYNAVVSADALNVRTLPSSGAPTAGAVKKGDYLLITKQETVSGITWGYTPAPINGWVMMEYVNLLEPVEENKTMTDIPVPQNQEVQGYGVAVDAASIKNIEIEWAAGSILIQPMDITEIRISEEGSVQSADPMVWNVQESKLSIQYSKNTDHEFGFGLNPDDKSKYLFIQVPLNWQCNSLEVDAASASLEVKDLAIQEMEFDGGSGTCIFNNCTVDRLELDTASGDVLFKGSLNQMECDSASANVILELSNVPRNIEMDTASGDLDVVLPEGSGFSVAMETMSGEFASDFTTTNRNGRYIAGDGRCQIEVDGMSGSVNIRKGQ